MKILNSTKNTVYLEDIDRYISFSDGDIIEFSETELLRSRGLQTLILTGKFDVVEYSNSRIDQNIKRMNESMAKLKSIMPKEIPKEDGVAVHSDHLEVVIKGHFLEGGGYAKVNRNLALGLESLGVKVSISVIGGNHADLNDDEISRIAHMRKPGSKNAIHIDSVIPSFANVSGGKYKILYTTVESQSVPKQFVESCAMYNEIWVTSDFCAEILKKSGVDRPIFVLPDSINTNHYTDIGEKYKFNPELNDFVFISVFGWSYRKGYDVLLKAYLEEFSNKDNVSLLLLSKYQGNHKKSDVIKEAVGKAIEDFGGKTPAHVARCSRNVPERDMPSMYRACDAFVLFSRGEGFGIPYAESSLCGLPVISTDCSGQKMFLNSDNSTLVPVDTISPIQPGIMHVHYWDNQLFPQLTSKKVIDDARAAMRNVFENKEKFKKKNKILQKFLVENYSIESICNKAKKRLEEISNKLLKDR